MFKTNSPLPIFRQTADTTSFAHVKPYIYQALDNLKHVFDGRISFKHFYVHSNPLASATIFSTILGAYSLILAEVTGNYSQVDRMWSVLPALYTCHFTLWSHLNDLPTSRLDLLAGLTVLWSIRLTFNYWRKGGYQVGHEDYRWAVIKEKIGRVAFFGLNVTFISWMQNWLLLSVACPVYLFVLVAKSFPAQEQVVGPVDVLFAVSLLTILLTEFTADQQQWDFHQAKDEYKRSGKTSQGYSKADIERGFLCRKLFKYSRHPNFACEQTFWVTIYLWGAYATGTLFNWTGYGALAYLALFQGSTWLTELFTARKYDEYSLYQRHVSKFVPWFSGLTKPYHFPGGVEVKKTQ